MRKFNKFKVGYVKGKTDAIKTATLIYEGVPESKDGYYNRCSACNTQRFAYDLYFQIDEMNYCPHCGAKFTKVIDENGKSI